MVGCPGQPTSRLHGRPIIVERVERHLADLPAHGDVAKGRAKEQRFELVPMFKGGGLLGVIFYEEVQPPIS